MTDTAEKMTRLENIALYLVLLAAVEVAGLRSSLVKVIERFNGVPLQAGFTLRSAQKERKGQKQP